jgi:hypothetical protein
MAGLILEIVSRQGSQFHPVSGPVVRIGRALDNDIIISDPTVSPYHCVIRRRADATYELVPIADENGIYLGDQRLENAVTLIDLPLQFEAGHTRMRLFQRDHDVAPTRLINCNRGRSCLLGKWRWALLLLATMTLLSGMENYLSTPRIISWESFWGDQVVILGMVVAMIVVLLVVARLVSHRWDVPAAVSFVSLALIGVFLLDYGVTFANYFFSSELPGYLINLALLVLVLPLGTAWLLIRYQHGNPVLAWVLIALMFSPSAYLQIKEAARFYNFFDTFSRKAYYSRSLYPWDIRLKEDKSIQTFATGNLLNRDRSGSGEIVESSEK